MIGDDPVNPSQTQPAMGRIGFGGEERFKNAWQHVRKNPAAVVRELHAHIMAGGQLHRRALDRFIEALIVGAHRDPAFRTDRLDRVLQNLDKGLLHLGLVEIHGEQPLLQVKRPNDPWRAGLLKQLDGPGQRRVQIAGRLGAGVLLLTAERSKVLGDFRRLLRRPLHFQQGAAPRMVRLHFAQDEGGVAEDARQRVVEIEGNRAGQLEGALQFLPLCRAGLERKRARSQDRVATFKLPLRRFDRIVNRVAFPTRHRGLAHGLEQKEFLSGVVDGTDISVEADCRASFDAKLQLHHGRRGPF